jgi:hypothetical protein
MRTEVVDADMRLLDIGDVHCRCGLVFRYALTAAGPTFWQQNSVWGFCTTPLDGEDCTGCSSPLAGLIRGNERSV